MHDFDDEYLSVGISSNSRSPWEALTPSPSPTGVSDGDSVSQLAPEIEEVKSHSFVVPLTALILVNPQGNVEYKLKLLNPAVSH